MTDNINIDGFIDAYMQPDIDYFLKFCTKNNLINDDVIKLLEKAYGKKFVDGILNVDQE